MYSKYHYIYDLKERLNDYADDSELSIEHLSFLIDETRALVIKQSYQGYGVSIPNTIKQRINLTFELVQENDFVDLDKTLRSVDAVPRLIEGSNVKKAVNIDNGSYRDIKFIRVDSTRFPYVGINKYLRSFIYWMLGEDYKIYLHSGDKKYKLLENTRLYGVFENPKEAWEAGPDYSVDIDFNDTIYPIDSDMWIKISDIIIKTLSPKLQVTEDKVNDAND